MDWHSTLQECGVPEIILYSVIPSDRTSKLKGVFVSAILKIKCPAKPKIAKRYGHQVAQVPNALNDVVCSACGHDHESGRTPKEIALDIRLLLITKGVNIR